MKLRSDCPDDEISAFEPRRRRRRCCDFDRARIASISSASLGRDRAENAGSEAEICPERRGGVARESAEDEKAEAEACRDWKGVSLFAKARAWRERCATRHAPEPRQVGDDYSE